MGRAGKIASSQHIKMHTCNFSSKVSLFHCMFLKKSENQREARDFCAPSNNRRSVLMVSQCQ